MLCYCDIPDESDQQEIQHQKSFKTNFWHAYNLLIDKKAKRIRSLDKNGEACMPWLNYDESKYFVLSSPHFDKEWEVGLELEEEEKPKKLSIEEKVDNYMKAALSYKVNKRLKEGILKDLKDIENFIVHTFNSDRPFTTCRNIIEHLKELKKKYEK